MNIIKRLIKWVSNHKKIIIVGALIIILLHRNIFNLLVILSQFITGEIYITYEDIIPAVGIIVTGLFSYLILKVSRQQIIFDEKRKLESKLHNIESESAIVKSLEYQSKYCVKSLYDDIDQYIDKKDIDIDASMIIWFYDIVIRKLQELNATGFKNIENTNAMFSKIQITDRIDILNNIKKEIHNKKQVKCSHLINVMNSMVEYIEIIIEYSDEYMKELANIKQKLVNDIEKCSGKLKVL